EINDLRVDGLRGLVVDPQPFRHARTVVVHQQVGAGDQLVDDVTAGLGLEVDHDGLFAARGPHGAVALPTAQPPHGIAFGRFDFDGPGAHIGDEGRCVT